MTDTINQRQSIRGGERYGVLLINIGTPDDPGVGAVRRFLREFLSDARVLTMPAAARWLLVNLIIAPFRAPKSSKAYKAIWTTDGSPLMAHSVALEQKLAAELGPSYVVRYASRYGNPDLERTISVLLEEYCVSGLVVVPLYPQYSSSASATAVERVFEILSKRPWMPRVKVIDDFFDDAGFIGAQAALAKGSLEAFNPDHVIMSFHGLPESHMKDIAPAVCLGSNDCCAQVSQKNRYCYRAQCFATAGLLAGSLGIDRARYTVSFQSRLGRVPWIKPYTDEILTQLAESGVKRLAIMAPSFVADCLETVEELGIRAREDWKAAGGSDFLLIPCVNSDPRWVKALASIVQS